LFSQFHGCSNVNHAKHYELFILLLVARVI
jgi:hypothetical protein